MCSVGHDFGSPTQDFDIPPLPQAFSPKLVWWPSITFVRQKDPTPPGRRPAITTTRGRRPFAGGVAQRPRRRLRNAFL